MEVQNARIKESGGKIDEDVLRWFGHVERMENARIAKRFYYVGKSVGSEGMLEKNMFGCQVSKENGA